MRDAWHALTMDSLLQLLHLGVTEHLAAIFSSCIGCVTLQMA